MFSLSLSLSLSLSVCVCVCVSSGALLQGGSGGPPDRACEASTAGCDSSQAVSLTDYSSHSHSVKQMLKKAWGSKVDVTQVEMSTDTVVRDDDMTTIGVWRALHAYLLRSTPSRIPFELTTQLAKIKA